MIIIRYSAYQILFITKELYHEIFTSNFLPIEKDIKRLPLDHQVIVIIRIYKHLLLSDLFFNYERIIKQKQYRTFARLNTASLAIQYVLYVCIKYFFLLPSFFSPPPIQFGRLHVCSNRKRQPGHSIREPQERGQSMTRCAIVPRIESDSFSGT